MHIISFFTNNSKNAGDCEETGCFYKTENENFSVVNYNNNYDL